MLPAVGAAPRSELALKFALLRLSSNLIWPHVSCDESNTNINQTLLKPHERSKNNEGEVILGPDKHRTLYTHGALTNKELIE